MKTVEIDRDIYDYLAKRAEAGESLAVVIRRELNVSPPVETVEIEDDTYQFILSRSTRLGESASEILRRELRMGEGAPPVPGRIVAFRIASGTGSRPWNAREAMVVATVGDTLRIVNDDAVPHRLHTNGAPFPHPGSDTMPGTATDFVLEAPFDPFQDGPLYNHNAGNDAEFWITVRPRVG